MRILLLSLYFVVLLSAPASRADILANFALTPMLHTVCISHVSEIATAFTRRTNIPVLADCYESNGQEYLLIRTVDNQGFRQAGALASGSSTTYTHVWSVPVQVERVDYMLRETGEVVPVTYDATIREKVLERRSFGRDVSRCENALSGTLNGGYEIAVGIGLRNPFAGYCYLNSDGVYEAQLLFTSIQP